MSKFNNKKAFKIVTGSTKEKVKIIFPKRGSCLLENWDSSDVKILLKGLQIAFDQGYEKCLRDKNLYKNT